MSITTHFEGNPFDASYLVRAPINLPGKLTIQTDRVMTRAAYKQAISAQTKIPVDHLAIQTNSDSSITFRVVSCNDESHCPQNTIRIVNLTGTHVCIPLNHSTKIADISRIYQERTCVANWRFCYQDRILDQNEKLMDLGVNSSSILRAIYPIK